MKAARKANLTTVSNEVESALYEVRKKIHPRAVHGWFASWRVALVVATQLIFYGLPWLEWNGRQAVLFDLGARKFYIFGAVFWPQDFIFLTGLLVISALSLFLFTAVAGRLFCGYACPQTVYTEIFLWVERMVEGDHVRRMRLDKAGLSAAKLGRRSAKHAIWIALSLWTGFTFVGYFTPIHTLLGEARTLSFGGWEAFWVLFYGFATYGNAGWMREQVCKYMCPYARFQSVMFDKDTLVITYDAKRGEPRGARGRSVDAKAKGLGSCVDCGICVQVCPVGIDIRRGLQYECIGCAACIDGCDQVMEKMNYPKGLIRYSSENAMQGVTKDASLLKRMFRPRVLVYSTLLAILVGAFSVGLYLRSPLKVDVIRDRAALARETREGLVENVYRLQIMNTAEGPRRYVVSASGLDGLTVVARQPIEIHGASTQTVALALRVDPAVVKKGGYDVWIRVEDADDGSIRTDEKTRLFVK